MRIRPTTWCVFPKNEPMFGELSYTITIVDEGCGEYLRVEDSNGKIDFNTEEWPHLRDAIEFAIKQIKHNS